MRGFPYLCLGILLILAGCTGGPIEGGLGQAESTRLALNNSANTTHTFEIWIAEGKLDNKDITIRKKDGEIDQASPDEGLTTYKLDGDYGYVTSVELPPDKFRHHGRYTLDPGENNQTSIKQFKKSSTVVVAVSSDGRILSLVAAYCGNNLAYLEVTMFGYGSGSSFYCEGGLL